MADENRILGDIRPRTDTKETDNAESIIGGSQHDRTEHSGSRDVTQDRTGETDPDIRKRPE